MKNIFFSLVALLIISSCQEKQMQQQPEEQQNLSSQSIFNINSTWETATGEKIKLADLQGDVLAVTMVYTSCKVSCPRLAFDMKELEKQVEKEKRGNVKYVFISIDPENDTPEKMQNFLRSYKLNGDQWIFLRSNEDNTRELANVLTVRYKELSPMELSHSNIISVFSKNGVLAYQKEGLSTDLNETAKAIEKQL